jgi:DNA mismatch repair ATPase MutS
MDPSDGRRKRGRRSPSPDQDLVDEGRSRDAEPLASTVACVVENRARETVVAIARTWRCLEIYTLVDNASYMETTDLLGLLAPDEVLLPASQGASKPLMCRKVEKWRSECPRPPTLTPVSRAYFDQDRGAEFLRRVSVEAIDAEVLARYTVLGAAFALLKYIETSSGFTFPRASVRLRFIDGNSGDFLAIDRRTAMSLEILANARSGDQQNSLFGKIDHTKVMRLRK